MPRADRLFQIIQIMRGSRGPLTAEAIGAELETSKRTVYRDIADLIGQRAPISCAAISAPSGLTASSGPSSSRSGTASAPQRSGRVGSNAVRRGRSLVDALLRILALSRSLSGR